MIIALDYDDTFTADPELWAVFVKLAQHKGHRVYCVTARRNSDANKNEISDNFTRHELEIPIVFCNLKPKRDTMLARGLEVDIWIDDSPFAIVSGY